MFITITFYDGKRREVICSDYDSAHTICESLDNNVNVTQWKTNIGLNICPWYQKYFGKKLKDDFNDWKYS